MKYTKYHGIRFSKKLNQNVSILQYESKDKIPYCNCDECGKPITKKMFVLQDPETHLEMYYLGSDCIKKYM